MPSPGSVLGVVSAEAARSTGLCEGTLVVAGGGNGQCAGLGSNALSAKQRYLNFGTALVGVWVGSIGWTMHSGP